MSAEHEHSFPRVCLLKVARRSPSGWGLLRFRSLERCGPSGIPCGPPAGCPRQVWPTGRLRAPSQADGRLHLQPHWQPHNPRHGAANGVRACSYSVTGPPGLLSHGGWNPGGSCDSDACSRAGSEDLLASCDRWITDRVRFSTVTGPTVTVTVMPIRLGESAPRWIVVGMMVQARRRHGC